MNDALAYQHLQHSAKQVVQKHPRRCHFLRSTTIYTGLNGQRLFCQTTSLKSANCRRANQNHGVCVSSRACLCIPLVSPSSIRRFPNVNTQTNVAHLILGSNFNSFPARSLTQKRNRNRNPKMAARRAGAATASVGARIALLLLLYGALTCTDGTAAHAAAAIDAAPPLTAVLVHLHPPIDFAPQSLLSQQLREGQDEEKTAIKNAVGTRSESRERVHRVMSEFVRESQASVSALIRQSFQQAEGGVDGVVEVEHLWIQNALVVRVQQDGSVTETEQKRDDVRDFFERTLRWVPGVIGVEFDSAIVRLLDTIPGSGDDDGEHREASGGEKPQPNIELLHAPALWAQNVKGKGVVVANIDSGVRYTHESLRDNFRGTGKSSLYGYVCVSSCVI